MDIKFVCSKCGKPPEEDKEKSNKNWKVFKSECSDCGSKVIATVE